MVVLIVIIEGAVLDADRAALAVILLPEHILLVAGGDNIADRLLADAVLLEELAEVILAVCDAVVDRGKLLAGKLQTLCFKIALDCHKGLAILDRLVLDPVLRGDIVDVDVLHDLLVIRGGLAVVEGLALIGENADCVIIGRGDIIEVNTGAHLIAVDRHGVGSVLAAGSAGERRAGREQHSRCPFE